MEEKKTKRKRRRTKRVKITDRGRGRPKGTLRRFPFDETRIGFMLRYEMPIVYGILKQLCGMQTPFEPEWWVIDSVAKASKDVSYMKPKFQRYLNEYKEKGCYCLRGKVMTPKRQKYYDSVQRHKTQEYIRKNQMALKRRIQKQAIDEDMTLEEVNNIIKTRAQSTD